MWQVPKSNYTENYNVFREMLRELRLDRGVTQANLSEALGMPQSFVSKYEMGERRLDFVEVAKICHELGQPLTKFADAYCRAVENRAVKKAAKSKGGKRP